MSYQFTNDQINQLTYEYSLSQQSGDLHNTLYAITKLLTLSDQANTAETQGIINWLTAAEALYSNNATQADSLLRNTLTQTAWQEDQTLLSPTQIHHYIDTTLSNIITNILAQKTIDINSLSQQDTNNLHALGITTDQTSLNHGLINTLAFGKDYIDSSILTPTTTPKGVEQYNQWLNNNTKLPPIDTNIDSDGDLIPDSLDKDPYISNADLLQPQPPLGSAIDGHKLGGFGTVEGPIPLAFTPPPLPPRDPLSFDLNDDGKIGTLSKDKGVYFDLDNSGFAEKTAWIAPEDGLLVLDRNNNQKIDGGAELFGTETLLANGQYANNGYAALAEFDSNNDNQITKEDTIFSQLKIWQDKNSNGLAEADELRSLEDMGILNIKTTYNSRVSRDANGVEHREDSTYTTQDGNQNITNTLWFNSDRTNAVPVDVHNGINFQIPYVTASLPNAVGFGNVYSLQEAMAKDSTHALQSLVAQFTEETNVAARLDLVEQILLYWTGQQDVAKDSRGTAVNAQHVAVMEMFWGQAAFQQNPTGVYAQRVETAYHNLFNSVYAQLLTQTHFSSFYNMIDFDNSTGSWTANFDKLGEYLVTLFAKNPVQYQNVISEFLFALQGIDPQNQTLYKGLITSLEAHATAINPAVNELLYEVIRFGDDKLDGTDNADTLRGYQGNDTLTGGAGDDLLMGNQGDDKLYGETGNDTLLGNEGNDLLSGGAGNDTLIGGQGNDRLEGGEGSDTYLYRKGDGNDTIVNIDPAQNKTDTLKFEGINASDAVVTRRDDNLIISLKDGSKVIVESYFNADGNGGYAVDNIQFADGTTWNIDTIKYLVQQGTAGNDILYGYAIDDTLKGLAGDDVLYGRGGSDTLIGGQGNDRLEGGNGNDTYVYYKGDGNDNILNFDPAQGSTDTLKFADINASDAVVIRRDDNLIINLQDGSKVIVESYFNADGNGGYALENVEFADGTAWNVYTIKYLVQQGTAGDDMLYGYAIDDTLTGLAGNDSLFGKGGNDTLVGGKGDDHLVGGDGNDTYLYRKGDGNDTLVNLDNTPNSTDKLKFEDINANEVTAVRQDSHLVLTIADGSVITVANYFANDGESGYAVDNIEFADGTSWNIDTVKYLVQQGTAGNDVLYGYGIDDTLQGLAGNDTLYGNGGNDTLIGGQGNDRLVGGGGNDTYVYRQGDGNDTVSNYDTGNGRNDTLKFEDITAQSVTAVRQGDNLTLQLADGSSVNVENYFRADGNGGYAVNTIVFANGVTWDIDTVKQLVQQGTADNDVLYGYAVDDILQGLAGNDTLIGNGGNDTLIGGDGNDTYQYRLGDGNDVIDNQATDNAQSTDTVQLLNIATTGVNLIDDDGDLVIRINENNQTIRVVDHFKNTNQQIDQIVFADGTVWNQAYIDTHAMRETESDDILIGSIVDDVINAKGGNDIITGNRGNDKINGGTGDDTYIFNLGDGHDTVIDKNLTPDAINLDIIKFGAGIKKGSLEISRTADDLVLTVDANNSITIQNWFVSNDYLIEKIEFNDGSSITLDELKNMNITGRFGDQNDSINGWDGIDSIYGGKGDDILSGKAGADTLVGGEGNDTLIGGEGKDTLIGGKGNDTYVIDGEDKIIEDLPGLIGGFDTVISTQSFDIQNTNLEAIQLEGTAHINATGNDANNVLIGNAGDNRLDGKFGRDEMRGGDGNDYYVIDQYETLVASSDGNYVLKGDQAIETTEVDGKTVDTGGVDTIERSVDSYLFKVDSTGKHQQTNQFANLEQNIENLVLTGKAISGYGNELDNTITLNSQNNLVDAQAGNDTVIYQRSGGQDSMVFTDLLTAKDTLKIQGYRESEVYVTRMGDDVVITFAGQANDQIILKDHYAPTLDNQHSDSNNKVDSIVFDSGKIWDTGYIEYLASGGRPSQAPSVNSSNVVLTGVEAERFNYNLNSNFKDPDNDKLSYQIATLDGSQLPSWLTFNPVTGVISGVPPIGATDVALNVIATDPAGLSTTANVQIGIQDNQAPVIHQGLSSLSAIEAKPFNLNVNLTRYQDPEGKALSFTLSQTDGSPLPSWLSFNNKTGSITGTAPLGTDSLALTLTATDMAGLSTKEQLTLQFADNQAPQMTTALADLAPTEAVAFSLSIQPQRYRDPEGSQLSYSLTQLDGSPLPAWMGFNGQTGLITGTSPLGGDSVLPLKLTVTDGASLTRTETIHLNFKTNHAPTLDNVLQDVVVTSGQYFTTSPTTSNFKDPEGFALKFVVTQLDGSPLPSWLHVNETTGQLSGYAPSTGNALSLKITAIDQSGQSHSDYFTLTTNQPPQITTNMNDQSVLQGVPFEYVIAVDKIIDPEHEQLNLTLVTSNGSPLPSWLSFDASSGKLTGVAPLNVSNNLDLVLKATDPHGAVDSKAFKLLVQTNQKPQLITAIDDVSVHEGETINTLIDLSKFKDPEGSALTYKVTTADNQTLPDWLSFDAQTGKLIGKPPIGAESVDVVLTATDGVGLSVSDTFTVKVTATAMDLNAPLFGGQLVGHSGNDTLTGSWYADTLVGNKGDDKLFGSLGNDILYGNEGNDLLDGGWGKDEMYGGQGNDTYVVDSDLDKVHEANNEGIDNVQAYVSYTLGNDVENLQLMGIGLLDGTGNSLNNLLLGNTGSNVLSGLAGNDVLIGGKGNDTLIGGSGNDHYEYNLGDGFDSIQDSEGNDTLLLHGNFKTSEVLFVREGNNLVISTAGNMGSVTIDDWFSNANSQVEHIQLDSGASIDNQMIASLFASQTAYEQGKTHVANNWLL